MTNAEARRKEARAEYEAALAEMFDGMSDDEIAAEQEQHIEWRHWQDADYCHDELERRKRAREAKP